MRKVTTWTLGIVICIALTGCSQKTTLNIPFDSADVSTIEMHHFTEPAFAEKKVITETDDINELYTLFKGLTLQDKQREPVAGGSVTSFRFNLADGTSYDLIYCSEAVKAGWLKSPAEQRDYFTSADIEGCWNSYDYEIIPAVESELPTY